MEGVEAVEGPYLLGQGTHCKGKLEHGPQKNLSGKHREFGNFAKTHGKQREFGCCSSCKFPDSKGKMYIDICGDNFSFFSKAG